MPFERVFAVADETPDGQAAIELAARIAQQKDCSLHALLLVKSAGETPSALTRTLAEAANLVGRRLHTDTIEQLDPTQLSEWTEGALVTIGANLADRIELPRSLPRRALVLTQGATMERSTGVRDEDASGVSGS